VKANGSEKYEVMAEINMIPFIDIALVLLIIFMVMTPFLVKEQIKINLPKVKSAVSRVDREQKRIQINIAGNGAIYVDGETVAEEAVEDAIKRRLEDPENQPVEIAADKAVVFEKVVAVMDAAKRCGAQHLGVGVQHEESGGAKTSAPTPPVGKRPAPHRARR
jgi:biopolymer transport protein ExbD